MCGGYIDRMPINGTSALNYTCRSITWQMWLGCKNLRTLYTFVPVDSSIFSRSLIDWHVFFYCEPNYANFSVNDLCLFVASF